MAFRFVFIFLWIGLGEEPGWRGVALPWLLVGRTALAAALIVGVIHLVWHAPLYGVEYDSANVWPWGISVVCYSIVVCWIYLHTDGSLLMPMLMHASNNTIAFVWRMFEGGDQLRLWWIWCVLWVIAAIVVVLATGTDLGRKNSETASNSAEAAARRKSELRSSRPAARGWFQGQRLDIRLHDKRASLAKSMYRYSALIVTFSVNAHSAPAPIV